MNCNQAACQGHEITTWNIIQECVYFFGPAAIGILILVIAMIWIAKR